MNEVQYYLFLDIDGVINCSANYAFFHEDMGSKDASIYRDYFEQLKRNGDKDKAATLLKEINQNEKYQVGLFSNEYAHGEIYDKELVGILSSVIKEKYRNLKVVLVSSASDILESSVFDKTYWSALWGLNIVDGHALSGCGDRRYQFMLDYLKRLPEGEKYRAVLLDDLPKPETVQYGYIEVKVGITSDKRVYKTLIEGLFDNSLTLPHLNEIN